MIEVISEDKKQDKLISMGDMKPLQVGEIISGSVGNKGCYVMRTASSFDFEVMNLSVSRENKCWDTKNDIKVRLLGKGESITLKISNN